MTRRQFVQTTGIFAASSYNRILGANNRLAAGFIGVGGMGQANMKSFLKQRDVEVINVCDVYVPHSEKAANTINQKTGRFVDQTIDFRHLLEIKNIDLVCIATPDHWHALMTATAFQAGKHVYCEKPIAHRVSEIPVMVAAQEKSGRVFQSGQQQRSSGHFNEAVSRVQRRKLGEIKSIETWFRHLAGDIGNPRDSDPPPGLNWNMWCGPAPLVPFNPNRFLFNWRWSWDSGSGWFGDWGPHMVDIAEWGIGDCPLMPCGPSRVESLDWEYCAKDSRETPNSFKIMYVFDRFNLYFTYEGCRQQREQKRNWGIRWNCEHGSVFVNRDGGSVSDLSGKEIKKIKGENGRKTHENHWKDFVNAIRDGRINTRAGLNQVAKTNIDCLLAAAVHRAHVEEEIDSVNWSPSTSRTADARMDKYLDFNYRPPWEMPQF